MNKIIIGSRGSELALWQANFVKREIQKRNKNISIEIKIIHTKGDKILDVALSKIGDKGLFTKELERALLDNEIDLAVHSLKDLQTKIPDGLKLSAVTKRHAVEDVLIARKKGMTILSLRENAIVATGSLRRRTQLLHLRPDIKVVELRGNVPGRIKKFLESEWDAIILARAGVERLNLKKYISTIIPVEQILPAVGQGALGIEINENNFELHEILQSIHHEETYRAVYAEREFLSTLEGGCQVPIGAFGRAKQNGFYFDAIVGSINGEITFRRHVRIKKNDYKTIGNKVAKEMLKSGADKILNEIYNVRIK